MIDNTKAFRDKLRRKLAAGLMGAAEGHAREYYERVTETEGQRPLPWGVSRPGHPWRSEGTDDGKEYPFTEPPGENDVHGYECIKAGVDTSGLVARSGVTEEGLHLYYLSDDPQWTSQYGRRFGMREAYQDAREQIAEEFVVAAKGQQ